KKNGYIFVQFLYIKGTYPFVTSSNCSIGGVCTGLGIPPQTISQTLGVIKAYTTRVGAGPFPTELYDDIGFHLREKGGEYGSTTKRPRRCGWLDLVVVKYTHMINYYTALVLTKLDILDGFKQIKIGYEYHLNGQVLQSFPADLDKLSKVEVKYLTLPGWMCSTSNCRKYFDLPKEAQEYIQKIEELTNVPVRWIGVGQERSCIIERT
ncbi:adenylosuccinate synthetase-like, partial [Gordionus sp. m RMFG-2023]|uniref:adenylosuccinate synthetase-like n=1 Tax=Gordionus sp. m RMFG-2023 TaxID=3053472 RepID=UPI0031FBDF5B